MSSPINLLVVVDGIFIHGPQVTAAGTPDQRDVSFTINTLITTLTQNVDPPIKVTRATRNPTDPTPGVLTSFTFSGSVPDLSVYDEIWLFGYEGSNYTAVLDPIPFISQAELKAIADFMEGGGGVMAVGDHDGLGSVMCGMIPRVRSMRAWFDPLDTDLSIPPQAPRNLPGEGPPRGDTLRAYQASPGGADQWFFDNQSDANPQPLTFPLGTSHPILQGANGPISGFPDHMHEGMVITPWSYTEPLLPGDTRMEYPTVAGYQEKPVILAQGTTIPGHGAERTDDTAPCESNFSNETELTIASFTIDILCAYDGHSVNCGRVVTDSSFHHYLDLNLLGDPCSSIPAKTLGFRDSLGHNLPILDDLLAYYVNLAVWLRRVSKTCTLLMQNSTFSKDQLMSVGLPATFPSAFWVVMDGFLPSELGIGAAGQLTGTAPAVTFSVNSPANPVAVTALVTHHQLQILPFSSTVLTAQLPPAPNTPQRFLFPFSVKFTGVDGFVAPSELLTLTASLSVGGQPFTASAPMELITAANPYVVDVDAGNAFTWWLSTDLRTFSIDDNVSFFGQKVSDHYLSGPASTASTSHAATAYISAVIKALSASSNGTAGGNSFDTDLTETESGQSVVDWLPVNPATNRPAFNFAICRVRLQGTTPTGPNTTQAVNCRVFFRAFQAQNTTSTYDTATTYRETPIQPNFGRRVPLLGVQQDAQGLDEYVTLPFFAVDRVNLLGPADITTQSTDSPNQATLLPVTGKIVEHYFGVWLDMNQPTPLFPVFAPPTDWDNKLSTWGTTGYELHSINDAFARAPHQCLVAEVAFDGAPIPSNADASTSDKLAQRNLAYINGPNPGAVASRRMPHPIQARATPAGAANPDELMLSCDALPHGSTVSLFLPQMHAADIIALANEHYPSNLLQLQDAHTVSLPSGPVTFLPLPTAVNLSAGLLAGLLTIDLPPGIKRGDLYPVVIRQVTDNAVIRQPRTQRRGGRPHHGLSAAAANAVVATTIRSRRVIGGFQINIAISTKQAILPNEERLFAVFQSTLLHTPIKSRWYPVMYRYVEQLRGRVAGFGGQPGLIPPSSSGHVPGLPSGPSPPHHGPPHGGPHGGGVSGGVGGGGGVHGAVHHITGKVKEIAFDGFGEFESFLVETDHNVHHRFRSSEKRVLEVVRHAMERRDWISVAFQSSHQDRAMSFTVSTTFP